MPNQDKNKKGRKESWRNIVVDSDSDSDEENGIRSVNFDLEDDYEADVEELGLQGAEEDGIGYVDVVDDDSDSDFDSDSDASNPDTSDSDTSDNEASESVFQPNTNIINKRTRADLDSDRDRDSEEEPNAQRIRLEATSVSNSSSSLGRTTSFDPRASITDRQASTSWNFFAEESLSSAAPEQTVSSRGDLAIGTGQTTMKTTQPSRATGNGDQEDLSNNLPSTSATGEEATATTGSKISCPVCMDSLEEIKDSGKSLSVLDCGHVFCSECMKEAVKAKQCYVCRKRITKKGFFPNVYL